MNNTVVDAFDTDELGVSAVYQPDVLDRSIVVIINYGSNSKSIYDGTRSQIAGITVRARNDSTEGIAASEYDKNQAITMPPRKGKTARVMRTGKLLNQNAAFITFEVY